MSILNGFYSKELYVIKNEANKVIYQAGNAPGESQGYVPISKGVGQKKMKEFCISTLHEMCEEMNCTIGMVKWMGARLKPIRIPW